MLACVKEERVSEPRTGDKGADTPYRCLCLVYENQNGRTKHVAERVEARPMYRHAWSPTW